MISTVIFDMDGLMVDSEPMHYEASRRVLAPYGIELSREENARYVGTPDVEAFADFVERYRLPIASAALVAEKRAAYLALIEKQIVAQPGLYPLLDRLAADGYRLAVASSSPLVEIELILGRLGVMERFAGCYSAEQVSRGKPAPDLFLYAASRIGSQPEECLVLEDAPSGVQAARRAGMHCLAVPSEAVRGSDFSLADRTLDSLDGVYPALAELRSARREGSEAPSSAAREPGPVRPPAPEAQAGRRASIAGVPGEGG